MNETTFNPAFGVSFEQNMATARLWAPGAAEVSLELEASGAVLPMEKQDRGVWKLTTSELQPGTDYRFLVDGKAFADPAAKFQPEGPLGASRAIDLNTVAWTDHAWSNPGLSQYIIYELHTGTFTDEGTFEAAERKLDYLLELGVTAIEIMPVAAFPGERNWGYDGVFPYAVQASYGGPEGLLRLVNACHERGLAVILDVVYNHLGPEGNVLTSLAPYTTAKYPTPWGEAMNMDDAGSDFVRQYFIENALMWLSSFHIDALRLDAVHAIRDFGPKHFLASLAEAVLNLESATGRSYHLIAECDLNDRRFVEPLDQAGYGMDAQWVDEFHHALRVTCGEPREGYYSDFSGLGHLAKAFSSGYVFDGGYSAHRDRMFGTHTAGIPGNRFVVFSQNHDQVGNRPFGERSVALYGPDKAKLMAAATILSPFVPLLFMGEEYGEDRPFLYFMDHQGEELVEAVRKGRAEEFSFAEGQQPPDPKAASTFTSCKLTFNNSGDHGRMLDYYKTLIRLRKTDQVFSKADRNALSVRHDQARQLLLLRYEHGAGIRELYFNFSTEACAYEREDQAALNLLLCSDDIRWGGAGADARRSDDIIHLPALSLVILTN
ncbi:malto-oligosyltrehalose trehalohydrolase [Pedobacter yulinensis]|uniref:Malto-oligosyltrehalose trehalohydrolase n=1 Tax=Pedobacter yulinensis TaxID=2126353 RepID=A0A2T3HK93_9SPHI|nr:malto-oligosyltrehalose trehalohydrolase [Pedobacter yulinensis]PST82839.1 malto-oligosyltrehalose trehalohydrolase [Pedobacter yulinensis]